MRIFDGQTADGTSLVYTQAAGSRDCQVHLSGTFGGGTLQPEVTQVDGDTDLPFVPMVGVTYTQSDAVYIRLAANSKLRMVLTGATTPNITVSVLPSQENS